MNFGRKCEIVKFNKKGSINLTRTTQRGHRPELHRRMPRHPFRSRSWLTAKTYWRDYLNGKDAQGNRRNGELGDPLGRIIGLEPCPQVPGGAKCF